MRNLLSADFFRIRKDKIVFIALIILCGFSLFSPCVYAVLRLVLGDGEGEFAALGLAFNGRSVFVSSLSLGNNFGILLPILIGILVCKDFSGNTVRNKIIAGHSKQNVFFSLLISASLIGVVLFALYALLSLTFGTLILGYGVAFDGKQLLYVLQVLFMGVLIFAAACALTSAVGAVTRSIALTIIINVAAMFGLSILSSVVMVLPDKPQWLEIVDKFNPVSQIQYVSMGSIPTDVFLISIGASVLYIAAFTLLGRTMFCKKDQK